MILLIKYKIFHVNDKKHKYSLYRKFVAQVCKGYYVALLTDHASNEMFQELPKQDNYFTESDERLHLDLRKSNG